MPASRARVLVPVLLVLVVAAVVGGLLAGQSTGRDDAVPARTATPSADAGAGPTAAPPTGGEAEAPERAPDLTRRIEGDPMAVGPVDAPVGVVVYSDFGCPYCQQWAEQAQPAVLDYAEQGAVRLEWRDVSILGEDSARAAVAAAAAAQQDRYRDFHDALFADMDARSPEQLTAMAEQLGLDVEQFTADLTEPTVLAAVQQNIDESQSIGLQSTPSFLVGGTPVVGAQPAEVFVELIEAALAP